MNFFDSEKNVEEYIAMSAGCDGRDLVNVLGNYLPAASSVLEIGMGPGADLDILKENYQATGSDHSQIFLDKYRKGSPDAELFLLDAVTLEIDRQFDALYSNKVLHHLHLDELARTFCRQASLLRDEGKICHSFWRGEKQEEIKSLLFQYYLEDEIETLIAPFFTLLETKLYEEFEKDDSFLVVARKKN